MTKPATDLASSLRPLMAFDGLTLAMIHTRDGLLVEHVGGSGELDALAAHLSAAAEATRSAHVALDLGEPLMTKTVLSSHEVMTFPLGLHFLSIVFEPYGNEALVTTIVRDVRSKLLSILGGNR